MLKIVALLLSLSCTVLQSQRFSMYYAEHSTGVLLVLVCSSTVALSYNVIHSLMIQKTSAVTTTVLGEVKIVGLLLLSAVLLGKALATQKAACITWHTRAPIAREPLDTCPILASTRCCCSFPAWQSIVNAHCTVHWHCLVFQVRRRLSQSR